MKHAEKCPQCGAKAFEIDHESETGYAAGHDHRYLMICEKCDFSQVFYSNVACECEPRCGSQCEPAQA